MQTRKTITIVTSPPTNTRTLPAFGGLTSPTGSKKAPIYRVEERSRTIYVASDVDPSQWDTHSLNTIFSMAEAPDGSGELEVEQPIRRAHSVETQYIVMDEAPGEPHSAEEPISSPRAVPNRISVYHPRRQGVRSAGALEAPPLDTRRGSPGRATNTPPLPPPRRQILFYHKHDPYYGFTNFSAHPVIYNGKKYPTSEHLFQSFKFQKHRPNLAEHIRTCSERPSVAFSEARRFQPEVRPDWKQVNIAKMDEALFHKFTQHADLQADLLGTGDAELIEDSDKDAFWGVGADRKGRNELGKCLERLRTKLRGFNQ